MSFKNTTTGNFLPYLLITFLFSACGLSSTQVANDKDEIESKINAIVDQMTLEEKVGQLALRGGSSRDKDGLSKELIQQVRNGEIGAFLNIEDTADIRTLQKAAVEESKHGIPLIFARDVIHGFKTLFPIPLGQAASWNPEVAKEGSRVAALEASAMGIRWTFAPMLDISQDSRWGRIAESPGEDPYLGQVMSAAYINGFQGDDLSDPTKMAACAKHYLGYGAAIGGRDYNTAIISNEQMYNTYLPPFKTAVENNAATFMSSFNEINGVPASGNKKILTDILRGEYQFDGFVVSDWNSITEMIPHGFAENEKEAAKLSANAGLDMEMTSEAYDKHFIELIKEGKVAESQLDFYVKNILRIKFRLGLFDQPYIPNDHPGKKMYAEENLQLAKNAAIESSVLLKNEGILPLKANKKILLTGPLADKGKEQLGTWAFDGEEEPSVTPREAMESAVFEEGLTHSRDKSNKQFNKVVAAAKKSDVIVFVGGEEAILSGEAHSRANIKLPGAQEELLQKLLKLNKPVVMVIMAGRPINITEYVDQLDAVLMMWHPGTMGGPALEEILYGKAEPSGRLPVSWPKAAGQLPYFYNHKNTGRPADPEKFVGIDDIPVGAWQSSLGNESHYLDVGYTPLYPFGYGLSYSEVKYDKYSTSMASLQENQTLTVQIRVTNIGVRETTEVVQLYIRDRFGRITRPVRQLKRFEKVTLAPKESKMIQFELAYDDFKYYDNEGVFDVEEGEIDIFVGSNSTTKNQMTIRIGKQAM
ncbi:glycoside hydrolase family 3 C-terminal domain-containing protein [Flammeovirga yaeyamensis]|uniref:beta-glucosidase n=1 Tax=Flammeovirga yaeyamensis TaxID=367791 RepID=A0AAX1N4P3_9BACT|nr:glycoside hydrolase family 3 N-terminal domain-containing protein [Flammeovirga yaeyamensis]MBB3698613.1 beta-glucosidase [Flammeovirga yaeyamensis]QWG01027.1 glycoside hydrolase family 3 C-terminal domain-containing protein [Flammeovirga yaeyamensis]